MREQWEALCCQHGGLLQWLFPFAGSANNSSHLCKASSSSETRAACSVGEAKAKQFSGSDGWDKVGLMQLILLMCSCDLFRLAFQRNRIGNLGSPIEAAVRLPPHKQSLNSALFPWLIYLYSTAIEYKANAPQRYNLLFLFFYFALLKLSSLKIFPPLSVAQLLCK